MARIFKECCGLCLYFRDDDIDDSRGDDESQGACHRYPPKMPRNEAWPTFSTDTMTTLYDFPGVLKQDWCGEFKAGNMFDRRWDKSDAENED